MLPFTALRAFEAVARLGSFSDAAAELGVSQSAVSQQVKTLEAWVGRPLLVRSARRSRPTAIGTQLAGSVSAGMGQIAETCSDLRDTRRTARTITIGCLPGFAFLWLFPRLLEFDLAHPDLSISVTTERQETRTETGQVDVWIRYGSGDAPGFSVVPLIDEVVTPVCAPALLTDATPLRTVRDLKRHTQLRDAFSPGAQHPPTWEFWADVNRLALPKPARIRTFDQSHMVVQAAISGLGVALGRTPLISAALADRRLIRPFAQSAHSKCKYWLVCKESALRTERITRFLNWAEAEASSDAGLPEIA